MVTADEVDPQVMFLQVRIDGDEVAKGNLNGTAHEPVRADRGGVAAAVRSGAATRSR